MAERKHITLIYQYNDNWIGGTYYIINIIKALNFLEDARKPKLTVIIDHNSDQTVIKELNYPYIKLVSVNLSFSVFEKILNRLARISIKKPVIKKKVPGVIENLYPVSDFISTENVNKFYYWIPDFQEHYLPEFFSKGEINDRVNTQTIIQKEKVPVVFSSHNAMKDFNNFYQPNDNKKEILNFVSILGNDFLNIPIGPLLQKYSIDKPYFMIPNQFWKHKNHWVVLESAKILSEEGIDFQIVFTGKEFDHRHPNHVIDMKNFVKENNLEKNILFLGFIDRNDQLQLMKNSQSIIQPSLFEGWSTVVEDTKAINHFIILSDIDLHKEQIKENCLFFNPRDPIALASQMKVVLKGVTISPLDYNNLIVEFAIKFVSIF